MKSLKVQLIAAIAMTMVAALTIGSSTYAWFAMNKTVTASGMQVRAQADGSVIITDTTNLPTADDNATDYTFPTPSPAVKLYASTHDSTKGTLLKTLKKTSAADINLETGLPKHKDITLDYDEAINTETKEYYKDFSVYIAGNGQAFSNQKIDVTLTSTGTNINKAVSVDFYGAEVSAEGAIIVSSDNYKGTLNIAGVKNGTDGKSITEYKTFTIPSANIPEAGTSKAYQVTMRVYFDGALIEIAGTQPYTEYESVTGTASSTTYYYSDNQGTGPITITGSTLPANTYKVKSGVTKTYARTTEVAKIADVTMVAKFAVKD